MTKPKTFRQRGMAVIAALLVVVAASALATSVIERQGLLARILISEGERSQAAWALRAGLDWSRIVLQLDAEKSPTTRADGIWARSIIALPVGSADHPERILFSGQIEDEQGKFNLRNLAEKGEAHPEELLSLQRLLQWLNVDPSLAAVMAHRVAGTQFGKDGAPTQVGLRDIDDLRSLEGFTPQVINALQPFVTVLPATTPVNANTATAEVLGAVVKDLGLAGARELIVQRDKGVWFSNRADFVNRQKGMKPDAGRRITVNSNWFRVTGEVTVGDTMVSLRALLHRSDQGSTSIRWVTY
ncbi:MAG TPA: type II secretion system minor pseudopilin GspK [Burkholderiaceae bacterium]|nr:type II secretion system minor pseudopilin GspK [Burkholderiaceae bacterium]